jgi:hypothetical protein
MKRALNEARTRSESTRYVPDSGCARFQEACQDTEQVVPEGADLDRLADAWRDDPVADLGVHPGKLHARLASALLTLLRASRVLRSALTHDVRNTREVHDAESGS